MSQVDESKQPRLTQGYLTATGNLLALAAFQIPVNAIGIFVGCQMAQIHEIKADKTVVDKRLPVPSRNDFRDTKS